MNILFYGQDTSLTEALIPALMDFGANVYQKKKLQDLTAALDNQESGCLFLDMDSSGVDWIHFIKALKEKTETQSIFIVAFTNASSQEDLNELTSLGINGIFKTNQPFSAYVKQIYGILKTYEQESQFKRKYARVQPAPDETVKVLMEPSLQRGSINGRLRDISVAAAAVVIDIKDTEYFNPGQKLVNFQVQLNKKMHFCEAEVFKVGGDIIVVQFVSKPDAFKNAVSDYIFKKINFQG